MIICGVDADKLVEESHWVICARRQERCWWL